MKDGIAKNIWMHLYEDFSRNDASIKLFANSARLELGKGFKEFRKFSFPALDDSLPVTTHRYAKQLEHFFDRFIANSDEFQQETLEREALTNFVDAQKNVLTSLPKSERSHRVLQEMRRILGLILGPCPDLSTLTDWKIPEKASVGTSRSKGYLYEKLNNFSGTPEQQRLFKSLLGDGRTVVTPKVATCVTVVAVEKKWNKNRIIAADTVASGVVSNALGSCIAARLKDSVGIDIKVQQHVHRKLVKQSSVDGKLATLDLSAASDSISFPLLRRVLPSDWMRCLRQCRTRHFQTEKGGTAMSLQSFMTMGVGYTFPLQTAIYYAMIQATKNLLRSTMPHDFPGIISVYGDDCIFPVKLYPYVVTVMKDLGFVINENKSFHTGHFRESCGEDCYKGCSVRPAFLKWDDEPNNVTSNLYQIVNSLLRRFNVLELPRTLQYLVTLIGYIDGTVLRVPLTFPERSGIQVNNPDCYVSWLKISQFGVVYSPIYYEFIADGQGLYKFLALQGKPTRKHMVYELSDHRAYLVESLRNRFDETYFHHGCIINDNFVPISHSEPAQFSKWAGIRYGNKRMSRVSVAIQKKQRRNSKLCLLVPSKVSDHPVLVRTGCEVPWWTEQMC